MKKRTLFASLLSSSLALSLVACSPTFRTDYVYQNPETNEGRYCVNQCLAMKSSCESSADVAYNQCVQQARLNGKIDYATYIAAQKITNTPDSIQRTPESFDSSYNCRRSDNCIVNYNQCFQNCGGQVTAHTVCTSNCDKVKPIY